MGVAYVCMCVLDCTGIHCVLHVHFRLCRCTLRSACFRLYWRQNGSDNAPWRREVTLQQDPSVTTYVRNVTRLQPDEYYVFRVDVHYSDDNKVVERTSAGLVSHPPILVPCTSEYCPQDLHLIILSQSVGTSKHAKHFYFYFF